LNKSFLSAVLVAVMASLSIVAHAASLGVPAYSYPTTGSATDFWFNLPRMAQVAPKGQQLGYVPTFYVMNPNSGVGASFDANYGAAVYQARVKGIQMYGYIPTNYGAISADSIINQALLYKKWYGVDGIFLDETQLDSAHYNYYAGLTRYFRTKGLKVIFNPGIPNIDRKFADLADHILTFEGDYAQYQALQIPSWMYKYPANKFWHVVYGVTDAKSFKNTLQMADTVKHAGVLYMTDDVMPNPYDVIPSYWSQELKLLNGKNF